MTAALALAAGQAGGERDVLGGAALALFTAAVIAAGLRAILPGRRGRRRSRRRR